MKKLILLSALLAAFMIGCKKKKNDPAPSNTANSAPTVSLTNPVNGTSANYQTISISANATDSDGSIAKVEFYDGATKLGEDATSPYSLDVALDGGTHSLTAKAYDNENASATSAVVTYTVNKGPVAEEPSPAK